MNNEKENQEELEIKGNEEEFEAVEKSETSKISNRKLFPAVIAGIVLLSIVGFAAWYFLLRGEEGKPVPPPRNVSFDGKGETDSTLTTNEQKITLTDEQLRAADLKIITVGEELSKTSVAASTTGVVRPNDYRETPVITQVGGVARNVSAELGDFVRAGQPIAVVYSEELAQAEAKYLAKLADVNEARKRFERAKKLTGIASESRDEIDKATAQLKIAEAEHEEHLSHFRRTQKLVEIGAVSREEFEMVETKHETAMAKLEEAKNRFERAKKLLSINPARSAEQDNAQKQLQTARADLAAEKQKLLVLGLSPQRVNSLNSVSDISSALPILSPVSGTVTGRKVNSGEVVPANSEIITVTNLSTVWVIGQVYEKDLASLRVGSGASVTTDAYPGVVFRGNISYIDPNLDETTRTAQVRIELPNAGDRLKIGMYVNIAFATIGGSENTVPTVPKEAVQDISGQKIVFVATETPNTFILRPVRLGAEKNGRFAVLEGLFVGEKVVTEGSFLLRAEWNKTN